MRIFMTGATGFVGRATVLRLRRSGHEVIAWVRNPAKARGVLGSEAKLLPTQSSDELLQETMGQCDAVINLAGEPVAGKRWSKAYKDRLVSSRTNLTKRIVDAMGAVENKPKTFICASAVGYYGNRGDDALTESSSQGEGFLASLCQQWEAAALEAEQYQVRTAVLRIGVILGHGGGALTKMLPFFQSGLGGALGNGDQYMPWVHLHDVIEAICFMLENENSSGVYNLCAPTPCTSREFGKTLGAVLNRPAFMPAPSLAIKMLLGEAATIVLNSQRVFPKHLLDDGFEFKYRELGDALKAAVVDSQTQIETFAEKSPQPCAPQSQYLQKRRPRYLLNTRIVLNAPVEEVFAFFSRPENLGAITPPDLSFNILDDIEDIQEGTIIHYAINMGALPMKWQTQIAQWEPQTRFVDSQTKGPYSSWWHEHHFLPDGDRTIMEDRVYYTPPFGLLGQLVNRFFIASKLRHIFKFRYVAMEMRFGTTTTRS